MLLVQLNSFINLILRYLDLWFFPLIDVGLFDLKVDTFYASCAAHDFNATEVRLEVVKNTLGLVQELIQSTDKSHALKAVLGRSCSCSKTKKNSSD